MPELDESNFIKEEGGGKLPFSFLFWLIVLAASVAILSTGSWLVINAHKAMTGEGPFYNVTNRDFSLFLWQNPEYMLVNVSSKSGYLPAFQYLNDVTVEPDKADQNVIAPPGILFLYHTWKRLLKPDFSERVITANEFQEFISVDEQWQPKYWSNAPKEYTELVENLSLGSQEQIQSKLPVDVKRAFQGWKNYFYEGQQIVQEAPTYDQMRKFLKNHPMYGHSYWRNIVQRDYLQSVPNGPEKGLVPRDEMTAFLKVGYYNATHPD